MKKVYKYNILNNFIQKMESKYKFDELMKERHAARDFQEKGNPRRNTQRNN